MISETLNQNTIRNFYWEKTEPMGGYYWELLELLTLLETVLSIMRIVQGTIKNV